jgi:glycosyltransferase involved in cell wall biosynthesis
MSSWPDAPSLVVAPEGLPPQPEPSRVKVLHVITRLAGGSGGNTLLSAAGMDPRRYDVWLASSPGGSLWHDARAAGITPVEVPGLVEPISPRDDMSALSQLIDLMRRERFAIVHTHSSKAGFLGRVAATLTRTPVVVHTFHGFAYHEFMSAGRRRLYLSLERLVRRQADLHVAVAPRVAREAVEMRLAPPGSVVVVPSGVELDRVPDEPDPELRRELGLPEGVPIVGTVGRIAFQKAPIDFVRMASIVRDARPDVRFVLVGDPSEDPPLEAAVRAEAERLGVEILFTGFRSDAPRIASLFDVFVITSLYEGLGRALTEAMATGRPVVATAVNGVPDLVEPGSTGLLTAPADPAGLARNVLWLLDHPEEGRRMGAHGRARVRSLFDPHTMCSMLDREYSRLLGLPTSGASEPPVHLNGARHRLRAASGTDGGVRLTAPPPLGSRTDVWG